jgi:HlyD family secretion protein
MTATADITVQKVQKALLVPTAALRFTPPVQEKKESSSGSLVGSLMPRPPQTGSQKDTSPNKKEQKVWTVKNNQLTAIPVATGLTNGTLTEITDGDIKQGTAVVVDMIAGE